MKNLLIIPLLGLALLCHCQTIIDINSTGSGSNATNLTVFAGKVYFSAEDGVNGQGIYAMDNNSMPSRLSPGLFENPSEFTVLDDRLYFSSGPFQSRQLYCIESSSPNLIVEIDNSMGSPAEFISHNGIHYFVNGEDVYRILPNGYEAFSIGSTNGSTISTGMPNGTDMTRKYIFVASDKLFFNTANGIYYIDLLQLTGAQLVVNSNNYEYEVGPPGGDYAGYYVGDKVIYRTIGVGMDSELLLIDASSSNPTADFINLSNATSSRPTFFIENQGILFFTAFNDDENMNVIWYINGSASSINDFNYISGVQSAQNNSSGAFNDPFIKVNDELFHFRNRIDVVNGVPNISQIEECFGYPYFNHQVINYASDYYYIGCCFDLFRCNDSVTDKLTCVGGIDNSIGKFVLLDDKFYLSSPTSPNFAIELLRWPEDQGNGICQENCENDSEAPTCDGNNFIVQLDPGQNYYTFDINDFATDECTPLLTYENASLDPSTPNGTAIHFWSGNDDQFPCGTYIITSSFPFDDAGNFNDCAFTFTVECSMDTCNNVAMHFDGINDRITVPSPFSGDSDYSISLDFKCGPQSNGPYNRLIGFSDFETEIAIQGSELAYYNGVGWVDNVGLNVADNIWHNVTLTKGSNMNTLYLDGNLISILNSPTLSFDGEMVIGHKHNNGSNEYFKGEIDNVKIWSNTLDSIEVCENLISNSIPNELYYNFEEGEAGENNSLIPGPIDLAGGDDNGVFANFNLNGNTSNYICSESNITCENECLIDTSPPVINCLNQVIEFPLNSSGTVEVSLADLITATDDCSEVNISGGSGVFDCSHVTNVPQYYTLTATNEIGLQSTCQQGFMITDPEGFCQPYTCPDEECPTQVIDLSTGLDNDNMILPIGQYAGNWQLIDGPDQGLNYPRPGYVLNPNLVWDQLPGSQYISPFPNASNNQSFSDPYIFERCFCVCQTAATVQLDIAAYVDNFINIGLYDDEGNVIGADLIDYQGPPDVNTFLSPAFMSNTTHELDAGTYCLRAELRNDGFITMGMELNAVVSGAGFIESKCCLPYSIITGTVFSDLQCDSLNNLNQDIGIENIEVYLSDASGAIIATSTTDQLGYYVFNDVPMGELYISQEPIPDNSLSLGSEGYQVVMELNSALGDFDFGNCMVEDTCCATSEELTNEVEASINSSIISIGDEVVINFPDLFQCQYVSKIWWGDGQVDVFTPQDEVAMHNYQSNSVYNLSIEVSAIALDGTLCQADVIDKCIIFKDCISSTEWVDPENAKFKVYPIPFQDDFNIDLSSNENGYNFSLFNVSGQLVKEEVIGQNILLYTINGSDLMSGCYILRLQDLNSTTVLETRIIKVE